MRKICLTKSCPVFMSPSAIRLLLSFVPDKSVSSKFSPWYAIKDCCSFWISFIVNTVVFPVPDRPSIKLLHGNCRGTEAGDQRGVNGSRSKFLLKFKPSAYIPKPPQTLEPRSARIAMNKLSRSKRPESQSGSKTRKLLKLRLC